MTADGGANWASARWCSSAYEKLRLSGNTAAVQVGNPGPNPIAIRAGRWYWTVRDRARGRCGSSCRPAMK
jgi:hypothetical protein